MASTILTPNASPSSALSPIGVSLPLPITNSSTSPSSQPNQTFDSSAPEALPAAPPPPSTRPPPTSPPVSQPPLPPAAASAPPQAVITPPPPLVIASSPPPPPANVPRPPSTNFPPPPKEKPPKSNPSQAPPPFVSQSPPSPNAPPPPILPLTPSNNVLPPPTLPSTPSYDVPPPPTLPPTPLNDVPPPSTPSNNVPPPPTLPSTPSNVVPPPPTPSNNVPPPPTLPSTPSNNVPPPPTLPSTPLNDVPPPSTPSNNVPPPPTLPSTPLNDVPPPSMPSNNVPPPPALPLTPSNNVPPPSTPSNNVPPPPALPLTPSNDVPPPSTPSNNAPPPPTLPLTPSNDVPPPSTPSNNVPPQPTLPSTPWYNAPPPPTLPSMTPPWTLSPPPSLPSPAPNKTASGSPTEEPTARPLHSGGLDTGASVAVTVIVGFLVLSLVVTAVWFAKKKKKKKATGSKDAFPMVSPHTTSQSSGTVLLRSRSPAKFAGSASGSGFVHSPRDPNAVGSSRPGFTYEELTQATNGFSAENKLGEGGFGCVYKGLLIDGREVAVKQLKIGGGQGEREFSTEVEVISRVHHRHLVSLVGYCISEHQRLLVYNYFSNDTLHYHLHGENRPVMDWPTRVKVAAGAARGIAYLHEDCHPRIIHRDIKSSNILLDKNFVARVSDFGLAKLALDTHTHVSTRVMGTFGYMAPEYARSGKLTEKSDIFSFGVVLLELITGRKPVDTSQPIGDESLVEWARPLLTKALESEDFEILVDSRLEKNYNRDEMFRMIEAAAACVRHSAVKRPKMSQVVRALDSLNEFPDLNNGVKPGQSSVYDNGKPDSAQIRMFRRMANGGQDSSSNIFSESQSSLWSREQEDLTNKEN